MDLKMKEVLHSQCKPHLITVSFAARASSTVTATRVELIITPR